MANLKFVQYASLTLKLGEIKKFNRLLEKVRKVGFAFFSLFACHIYSVFLSLNKLETKMFNLSYFVKQF